MRDILTRFNIMFHLTTPFHLKRTPVNNDEACFRLIIQISVCSLLSFGKQINILNLSKSSQSVFLCGVWGAKESVEVLYITPQMFAAELTQLHWGGMIHLFVLG